MHMFNLCEATLKVIVAYQAGESASGSPATMASRMPMLIET